MQYLDLQLPLDSATIGIMKGPFDHGLTVVWSAPYAHNGLAVEIQYIPEWLQVTPISGSVLGRQGTNLTVTLNSAGLAPGTYDGTIHITTNDPSELQSAIPVRVTVGSLTAVVSDLPREFDLHFSGANPSRGTVHLMLALPEPRDTVLEVFDVRGAVVRRVLRQPLSPGLHAMSWDGRDARGHEVASGVYFLRMRAGSFAKAARVTILR